MLPCRCNWYRLPCLAARGPVPADRTGRWIADSSSPRAHCPTRRRRIHDERLIEPFRRQITPRKVSRASRSTPHQPRSFRVYRGSETTARTRNSRTVLVIEAVSPARAVAPKTLATIAMTKSSGASPSSSHWSGHSRIRTWRSCAASSMDDYAFRLSGFSGIGIGGDHRGQQGIFR